MDYQKDKQELGDNKESLFSKDNQKKTRKKLKKRDASNTLPDPCVPPSPLHRNYQQDPFSTDEVTPSKSHKHPIVSMAENEENSPRNKDEN